MTSIVTAFLLGFFSGGTHAGSHLGIKGSLPKPAEPLYLKLVRGIYKVLLYNIGQGHWVSLVGLGRGEGGGWGVGSVYEKINI